MSVRSMLSRVRRLEQRSASVSPFVAAFGSFAAFEDHCNAEIAAGNLDPRDFPVVILCLQGWETQGVWGKWARNRTWLRGA